MTEKERVTVDLDAQCYYLDNEFWVSWDNYGEQMAEEINKLLNKQEEEIQRLKARNEELIQIIHKIRETDIKLWEND